MYLEFLSSVLKELNVQWIWNRCHVCMITLLSRNVTMCTKEPFMLHWEEMLARYFLYFCKEGNSVKIVLKETNCIASYLTSPHITSPRLASPHLTSPYRIVLLLYLQDCPTEKHFSDVDILNKLLLNYVSCLMSCFILFSSCKHVYLGKTIFGLTLKLWLMCEWNRYIWKWFHSVYSFKVTLSMTLILFLFVFFPPLNLFLPIFTPKHSRSRYGLETRLTSKGL